MFPTGLHGEILYYYGLKIKPNSKNSELMYSRITLSQGFVRRAYIGRQILYKGQQFECAIP